MKSKSLNKLLSIALITTIIPLSTPTYQTVSAETIPVQNPEDQPVPLTEPLTTTSTSLNLKTATKGGEKVDLQIDDKPVGSNSGVAQIKVEGKDTSKDEENQTIPITLLDAEGNPVEGTDKNIKEGSPASNGLTNQKETSITTGFKVTQNGDYKITTADGAGNISTEKLRISHIFKTEPTVNINTSIPTSPTNSPLDVTLTATPEAWSGYLEGDIQNKIKSATISQIEYTTGKDSQEQKRNKAEPLTAVPVTLTPSTTDTSGGSIPSTIEFTAPHSADYTLTITDDAGNTTTEKISINHIDLRGPSTDETENITALNPLKTWTKAPNQEFLLKFKSPSNTAFTLVPSDPVEEDVTYELIYNGFTEPSEGQTKGIAIVKATVVENGIYNLKLKDAIGEVSQEIAVTNFDRSGPKITISSDTSNPDPLLYGETGTSTSEMPIE